VKKNRVQWTRGEIGCLLSHLSVIQDAYNRGFKRVWILEDDVRIVEDVQRLPSILRRLTRIDPNWDIYYTDPNSTCFLYYDEAYLRPELRIPRIAQLQPRRLIDFDIMTTGLRLGAHSYIISRAGMEKVIHYFTHAPWYMPLDVEIHYIEGIREYSCPYYIVTTGMSIDSDTTQRPKNDRGTK
jgi:GR25 family glycosyltransferase involved in LPS biosynthesis